MMLSDDLTVTEICFKGGWNMLKLPKKPRGRVSFRLPEIHQMVILGLIQAEKKRDRWGSAIKIRKDGLKRRRERERERGHHFDRTTLWNSSLGNFQMVQIIDDIPCITCRVMWGPSWTQAALNQLTVAPTKHCCIFGSSLLMFSPQWSAGSGWLHCYYKLPFSRNIDPSWSMSIHIYAQISRHGRKACKWNKIW